MLKVWKLLAIKIIGINPAYYRMTGKTKLTIEKEGKKQELEGLGVWEQFYFGKNID